MLLALKRCCFILYKNLAFSPPLTATLRRFTLVPFFSAILAIGPPSQLFRKPNVGDDMLTTPSIPDPTLALHPSPDYCLATATITVALLFQLLLLPQPLTSHLQPTLEVPCQWLNQSFPHILRFYLHFFYLLY